MEEYRTRIIGRARAERRPLTCLFELTPTCNLRCHFCYVALDPYQGPYLSTDQVCRVLDILERAGFSVLAAGSGKQAIQMDSITPGTIHMLLSDVMMRDMSGPDVAKILKVHRPDVRVMLMSGYASGDRLAFEGALDVPMLVKPFRQADLAQRLRAVLDDTAET